MEERHKRALTQNNVLLVDELIVDARFMAYLLQYDVLRDHDRESINAIATKDNKACDLLSILVRRGPEAMPGFIAALIETKQEHIAEKVEPELFSQMKKIQTEGKTIKPGDFTGKTEKIDGASKMYTTKGIREASDHVREEFYKAIEELVKPDVEAREVRVRTDVEAREALGRIFEEQRKAFSPDTTEGIREAPDHRASSSPFITNSWDSASKGATKGATAKAEKIDGASNRITSTSSMDTGDTRSGGAAAKAEKIAGLSKMDTTKGIRDAPDHVREEYFKAIEELAKPEVDDRDARVRIFNEQRKAFSPDAEKHFKEQIQEREKIHFDFMAKVWPEMFKDNFKQDLPSDYPPHNHTKDALFAFLLAMLYDILKNAETDREKTLKKHTEPLVQHELDRHYRGEPHHPEYEQKMGKHCTERNIFEMAIGRLARNVQFNHGDVNMDQMRKFLPKFHLENKKEKGELYKKYMEKYQERVSQRSKELYYDKE